MTNSETRMTFLLALALGALAGCSGKSVELVESRPAMDTVVTVRAIAPTEALARCALAEAWKEMDECVFHLNRYGKPSEAYLKGDKDAAKDRSQQPSDLWSVNAGAGQWASEVAPLVATCLGAAREVYETSRGAFDPTVGPILDLWKEAEKQNRLPADDQIAAARALVGMDKVEILIADRLKRQDEIGYAPPNAPPPTRQDLMTMMCSVGLPQKGMRLDLGGIAKGTIAGRMARRMKQAGATAGLVAAAGDVYGFGRRPRNLVGAGDDPRWGVAVQDPRWPQDQSKFYTCVHIQDQGIDTSGHYYRGYAIGGKHYSHIVDPRTGRPVDTRIASVTVVAPDPALSDGLSTAIAVMGVKDGLAMIEDLADDGVQCLILEAVPPKGETLESAKPEEIQLIAHRSRGFAAMEFKPTK